jgi:hypothetical protein
VHLNGLPTGAADTSASEWAAAGAWGLQGQFPVFLNCARGWLQEQRIHLLANGRPLGHGDYKDASRQLRRLLKQYGNGSLEGGLRFVARNGAAQLETIALLSVDKPVSRSV